MIGVDPRSLRAVCVPLAPSRDRPPVDPVALAGDDGHLFVGRSRTVAGRGSAASLALPCGLEDTDRLRRVPEWLAAVPVAMPAGNSSPGSPPVLPLPVVALGALPFDRRAPATLVVPSKAYCRAADGTEWLVGVAPAGGEGGGAGEGAVADLLAWFNASSAGGARQGDDSQRDGQGDDVLAVRDLTSVPAGEDYARAVARAVRAILDGRLRKVVLARTVDLRFGSSPGGDGAGHLSTPRPTDVVRRLWGDDPAFSAFSVPVPEGRFVGASPELIVARSGREVTSLPLAGTVALPAPGAAADAAVAQLLSSTKDLDEHRLVVEEVIAGLSRHCVDVTVADRPTVVRLRSDARLGTPVRAFVPVAGGEAPAPVGATGGGCAAARGGAPTATDRCTVLELLAALHPTPAVGGVDRGHALEAIAALEAAPRGYWAGPVGWVDGTGDGEWVLAIRSATLGRAGARVHAGAGIVAESDPDGELAETTVKLAPVLDALVPGASRLLASSSARARRGNAPAPRRPEDRPPLPAAPAPAEGPPGSDH